MCRHVVLCMYMWPSLVWPGWAAHLHNLHICIHYIYRLHTDLTYQHTRGASVICNDPCFPVQPRCRIQRPGAKPS
ncbi:hypothetical protein F4810DRAFT_677786 [Camillea tinctor]|nr:hypothetical protein F4810DRAFT_677786 [Camillea tinctor]